MKRLGDFLAGNQIREMSPAGMVHVLFIERPASAPESFRIELLESLGGETMLLRASRHLDIVLAVNLSRLLGACLLNPRRDGI